MFPVKQVLLILNKKKLIILLVRAQFTRRLQDLFARIYCLLSKKHREFFYLLFNVIVRRFSLDPDLSFSLLVIQALLFKTCTLCWQIYVFYVVQECKLIN